MLIKNVKTGKPSYTLTMTVYGFAAVTLKLLVSGLTIGGFHMSEFSGVEYAAAVAALGGVYSWNKKLRIDQENKKEEQ